MGRRRGYWWSPTNDKLLVTSVDESDVLSWHILKSSDPSDAPAVIKYPKAGTKNSKVSSVAIVMADGAHDELKTVLNKLPSLREAFIQDIEKAKRAVPLNPAAPQINGDMGANPVDPAPPEKKFEAPKGGEI